MNNNKTEHRLDKLNIVLSTAMLTLLLAAITLFMFVISATLFADNPLLTKQDSCFGLLEGWQAENGETLSAMKLQSALFVPTGQDGQAEISCRLPQDVGSGFCLYFRSDCQGVSMYCDGAFITAQQFPQSLPLQPDMFRMIAVPMPQTAAGAELTLHFSAADDGGLYLQFPCCGTSDGAVLYILSVCRLTLITGLLALLLLIISLAVYLYWDFHGERHTSLIYLMLFYAVSVCWILADSGLGVLIYRYNLVSYFLEFSAPMLLTVLYLNFVQSANEKRLFGFTQLSIINIALLILGFVLHLCGVVTLRCLLPVYCGVIFLTLLFSVIVLHAAGNRQKNTLLLCSSLLLLTTAVSIILSLIFKQIQATILFRSAVLVFGVVTVVSLFSGVSRLQSKAMSAESLRQQKEAAEAKMLLTQINSHFFYNTINTIRGLIRIDQDKAYKMTGDFGKYIRYRVNSAADSAHLSSFKEELRAIRAYADIYATRMNDKLQLRYEIEADDFYIPTLTVEPFVENAITHGIFHATGEGTVTVRAFKEGNFWKVTVTDDGCGFDVSALQDNPGVGIANIRTRLSQYPGCSLKIDSTLTVGTTVTITYPEDFGGAEDETDTGR